MRKIPAALGSPPGKMWVSPAAALDRLRSRRCAAILRPDDTGAAWGGSDLDEKR
jgi:hypothetical protein